MKRLAILLCVLIAGCVTAPQAPPGTVVPAARLQQAVQPGVTTKAMLLAQLGATTSIRFDSGYEVWRYLTPSPAGPVGEFVVVIDPQGIVSKVRDAPAPYQAPARK
ncbi:MAG: hypothetical protein V4693_19570 [Pseudomonadota bacterium]